MRHLLAFSIDQKLQGPERQLNEYGIGLAVFRRDSCSYDRRLRWAITAQSNLLYGLQQAHGVHIQKSERRALK